MSQVHGEGLGSVCGAHSARGAAPLPRHHPPTPRRPLPLHGPGPAHLWPQQSDHAEAVPSRTFRERKRRTSAPSNAAPPALVAPVHSDGF